MSTKHVAIMDYGAGNLHSVIHAFRSLGVEVTVVVDQKSMVKATHIVLPGVGSMAAAMKTIRETNLDNVITSAARWDVPLLGICLGMHLLSSRGNEGGETLALDLIPGVVERLEPNPTPIVQKVPRLGWFDVYSSQPSAPCSPLFDRVPDGSSFYFAHSFHFRPDDSRDSSGTIGKNGEVALVKRGTVIGTQFHPEKSGKLGLRVLEGFLRY